MNRDWKPPIFLQTLDIHIYHAVDGGGLRALYMDESLYRYTEISLCTVLDCKNMQQQNLPGRHSACKSGRTSQQLSACLSHLVTCHDRWENL